MAIAAASGPEVRHQDVLARLDGVCHQQGLSALAERLSELADWVHGDLSGVEEALSEFRGPRNVVSRGAMHLLSLGGKRLRPTCVALAARVGDGFNDAARELAVAAELVHGATLLHDDVVDMGERRRGAPAARMLYGNAASIFAGDWLLVEALRRVRRAGMPDVLDRLLAVIEEMIFAEAIQLEHRGSMRLSRTQWLQVVEGKTAALFRWALFAGGRAGGLAPERCAALEEYGHHLGVAFQTIDDLLDYAGDGSALGKDPFADLREGKLTLPLIVSLEREPALRDHVVRLAREQTGGASGDGDARLLLDALTRTGAVEECRTFAAMRAQKGVDALQAVPDGRGKKALLTVVEAALHRQV